MEFNLSVGGATFKNSEIGYSSAYYPYLIPDISKGSVLKADRLEAIMNHVFDEYHAASSGNAEELNSLVRQMKRSCFSKEEWSNGCMGNEGLEEIDFSDSGERKLDLGYANAELRMRRLGCSLAILPRSLSSSLSNGPKLFRAIERVAGSKSSPVMPFYDAMSVILKLRHDGRYDVRGLLELSVFFAGAEFRSDWECLADQLVDDFVKGSPETAPLGTFEGLPFYARLTYLGDDNGLAREECRKKAIFHDFDSRIRIEESFRSQIFLELSVRVGLDVNPVSIGHIPQKTVDDFLFYNEQIAMNLVMEMLSYAVDRVHFKHFLDDHPALLSAYR